MTQMLKRIRIAGWKSIRDQTIQLGALTVIIGANGSGKSNLLSFFRLLEAVSLNEVPRVISRAGGASSVLHFGPKTTPTVHGETAFESERGVEIHGFNLSFAGGDKLLLDSEWFSEAKPDSLDNKHHDQAAGGQFPRPVEGGKVPDAEPAARIDELLGGIRIFHVHDTSETAPVRLAGYIEDNRGLKGDAGNLAAVLYLLQQRFTKAYRLITATVQSAVPGFDDFALAPQELAPDKILLNWKQQGSDYLFDPHQLSDGSLRFVALTTLFHLPRFADALSEHPDVGRGHDEGGAGGLPRAVPAGRQRDVHQDAADEGGGRCVSGHETGRNDLMAGRSRSASRQAPLDHEDQTPPHAAMMAQFDVLARVKSRANQTCHPTAL